MKIKAQSLSVIRPQRINFVSVQSDHECAFLAMLGFSDKLIIKNTGLTKGRIYARLRKAHIKRKDYRDGKSPLAVQVVERVADITDQQLEAHLNKFLLRDSQK